MEPSGRDKRTQPRVEAAIPIQVKGVDSLGLAFDDAACALEVSRRGLSFLSKHDMGVFAMLTIIIPGRGPVRANVGATDFFTEATVVRSVKVDEEFYRISVRFVGATLPMYSAEGI